MACITLEMDLPEGVTVSSYERVGDGHAFEVAWPLPERCQCQRCAYEEPAYLEFKDKVQVIRDLDLWGQPSFWVYRPGFHRCGRCHHRQHLVPPFKRKDVSYTLRFEEHVLRMLIGSNEEEAARRLGISAETVALIVKNQLLDAKDKEIDPQRVITDVGLDEISLKKRHKLYVTLLTDLSDPKRPRLLAVAKGRDEAAARACLLKLSAEQRQQMRTYRVDMGAAYNSVARDLLANAKAVIDRFHVAKLFGEAVDAERKKNHACLQGEADASGAERISVANVGVPTRPQGGLA
jgi:transposase